MEYEKDMFMEEKMMWKVGQCISDLRTQKNLSLSQLADLSMLSPKEMHLIENGYQMPEDINLHLMALALDVYPSSILKADPLPRRNYWEFMDLYDRTISLLDQVIEYNQAYMKVIDEIVADYPQMQSYLAEKLPNGFPLEKITEEQPLAQNQIVPKEEKTNKPNQQTPNLGGF